MKYRFKTLLACILLSTLLQSCIFVAGVAAGAAAIAVVYDHRTIKNVLSDTRVANRVAHKIGAILMGRRNENHVEATVFNQIVLLTGQVTTPLLKEQVTTAASSTPHVARVYNQITVEGPTSTLTRTSDTWITTKIKSQMLANDELRSGTIKVVTEKGVVYLMGQVTQSQATLATDIAREVKGVQRVMKVFQYQSG